MRRMSDTKEDTVPVRISTEKHKELQIISQQTELSLRSLVDRAADLLIEHWGQTGTVPPKTERRSK